MAHTIRQVSGVVEVNVWGTVTPEEVSDIIGELHRNDPRKEKNDLWIIAPESMIPFNTFGRVVENTRELVAGRSKLGGRSAVVAADRFRMAQLDMYRKEAEALPFRLRVFLSREDALKWLEDGSGE